MKYVQNIRGKWTVQMMVPKELRQRQAAQVIGQLPSGTEAPAPPFVGAAFAVDLGLASP
jgi:hypothetical protein